MFLCSSGESRVVKQGLIPFLSITFKQSCPGELSGGILLLVSFLGVRNKCQNPTIEFPRMKQGLLGLISLHLSLRVLQLWIISKIFLSQQNHANTLNFNYCI